MQNKKKIPLFTVEERVEMLQEVTKDIPNVRIIPFKGLFIDFAKETKSNAIVRGLRAVTDFEYELQIAQTNRKLSDGSLDTVFLTTSLEYAYLSSSSVKEIAAFNGDISQLVPDFVVDIVHNKLKNK